MNVLIAVASKHGATVEIARAIGRTLSETGLVCQVQEIDQETNPNGYDAVVIGSAVYMGHWMEVATRFVQTYATELAARPIWLFSSGPVGKPPYPDPGTLKLDEIQALTDARGHRQFGGVMNRDQLGLLPRLMATIIRAPKGDFRDWDEVRAWSREIAAALQLAAPTTGHGSTAAR